MGKEGTTKLERLAANHRKLIRESAITTKVAEARGYRTVDSPQFLRNQHFNDRQSRLVPGLLIPIWDVFGRNDRYQLRPDKSWKDRVSGKANKYENQSGIGVTLDINPTVRKKVLNAQRSLFITEGVRKGDALASKGLAAIALYGVYNWRGADEGGVVTALADWEQVPLERRLVYIAFDSDVMTKRSVQKALERLGKWLERKGADVRYIYLPSGPDGEKRGVDDFFAAGNTVDDLIGLAESRIRGLSQIVTGGAQLRDHTHEVVETLEKENDPPQIFRWATKLARVIVDEKSRAVIEPYNVDSLRGRMSEVANYYAVRGKKLVDTYPPKELATGVLALGPEEWPFPVLEGMVECPTLRADGTVLGEPGYDSEAGLIYIPSVGLEMPPVPMKPNSKQVRWALGKLDEMLRDFPFVSEADRANTVAFWLTPIVRAAIDGPVPIALVTAPQPGTGKSTIADLGSIIATGRPAEMGSLPAGNEHETRLALTTSLVRGSSLVVYDNFRGHLRSDQLSRALTARTWKDRMLHTNDEVLVPIRTTWAVTGNNIILGGDMPRRSYPIRLNADQARPWQRSGWLHEDIYGWATEERGDLLLALLVLARAWWSADCPGGRDRKALNSYDEWKRVIGGILDRADINGFLGNLEEMYDEMDVETEEWGPFLAEVRKEFGRQVVRAGEIVSRIDPELIPDVANAKGRESLVKLLGHQLRYKQENWFPHGEYEHKLVRAQKRGHNGYRVEVRKRAASGG